MESLAVYTSYILSLDLFNDTVKRMQLVDMYMWENGPVYQ